jgi:regulator of cell morphogenesis and NO signaling
LPRLVELAGQVERAHADKPDRPAGLAELLTEVRAAVESHLAKEEQILFPLIVAGRGRTA